jgi:molecular chaperone GrpE (heat shock protein)
MSDPNSPPLPKVVFYAGDLLLLVLASFICWQGHRPLLAGELWALVACVALGGGLAVVPHVLDHLAATRFAEADRLTRALERIQNLEQVSRQIQSATAAWQAVQDDAGKALQIAREVTQQMTSEARAFQEFLKKANDSERNHLRLEAEKLRRAEGEWVHVLVRILDHVYALHQAGVRSGNPALVDQLGAFQRACREVARRVGLVPIVAAAGEPFDAAQHQPEKEDPAPSPEARTAETLASGYRYQGILIRKALVVLQGTGPAPEALSIREIQERQAASRPAVATLPTEPGESASAGNKPPPTSEELPTEIIPIRSRRLPGETPANSPVEAPAARQATDAEAESVEPQGL